MCYSKRTSHHQSAYQSAVSKCISQQSISVSVSSISYSKQSRVSKKSHVRNTCLVLTRLSFFLLKRPAGARKPVSESGLHTSVTSDSTSSFTMDSCKYTLCGIDDKLLDNPFLFVLPATTHAHFKKPIPAYYPDAVYKKDKHFTVIHNRKGVYHQGTLTKQGTIRLGQRREDIELFNCPVPAAPVDQNPLPNRVFGKQQSNPAQDPADNPTQSDPATTPKALQGESSPDTEEPTITRFLIRHADIPTELKSELSSSKIKMSNTQTQNPSTINVTNSGQGGLNPGRAGSPFRGNPEGNPGGGGGGGGNPGGGAGGGGGGNAAGGNT